MCVFFFLSMLRALGGLQKGVHLGFRRGRPSHPGRKRHRMKGETQEGKRLTQVRGAAVRGAVGNTLFFGVLSGHW